MEESIYNIIPREYQPEPKGPLYKSKYPHNLPPTGSTFGNHTTSKPGVTQISLRCPTCPEISQSDCKPILKKPKEAHLAT